MVKPSQGWIRPVFFGIWGIMVILEKLGPNTLDHELGNTKSNFRGNLVWGNFVIWAGTYEKESKISKSMIHINRGLTQLVKPSQGWIQAEGLICKWMFFDLWISNSFASFINHQGQNMQSSKWSDFEKQDGLVTKQKFPPLLKKYGIRRMMLMVDSYHSLNFSSMKTVKTILKDEHTSLCRKLSKVVNFPLR